VSILLFPPSAVLLSWFLLRNQNKQRWCARDKPVIFAYPPIHRLIYRRTNHDNFHVRGYKEEGTITTPFDMTVLNDLDRFHLVMDAIDRLPQTGDKGILEAAARGHPRNRLRGMGTRI